MKYTTLGRTGVTVSRLCLGCMSYGDAGVAPVGPRRGGGAAVLPPRDRGRRQLLRHGRHVLARRQRGGHRPRAPDVRAHGRDRPRDEGELPHVAGPEHGRAVAQARRAGVRGEPEAARRRDDRPVPDPPLRPGRASRRDARGARPPRARRARCASSARARARRSASRRRSPSPDAQGFARFASMQNHYNLLYREEEREMLPLCAEEGIGVIPWSPLARGLLAGSRKNAADKAATARAASDDYARNLYDHPSDDAVIEAVKRVAAARGLPPAAVALAWLLSRPAVTAPIVGRDEARASRDGALRARRDAHRRRDRARSRRPTGPHAVRGFK